MSKYNLETHLSWPEEGFKLKSRHKKNWNPFSDRFLGVWNFLKIAWFAITLKNIRYLLIVLIITIITILVYFVEIYFKDRVVCIHKWFLLNLWKSYWMKFPQICEITAANDSIKGWKTRWYRLQISSILKNFLRQRLDLISCLS